MGYAAERQGLKFSKQMADRKRMEGLLEAASHMKPSSHWRPPVARARDEEEVSLDSKVIFPHHRCFLPSLRGTEQLHICTLLGAVC
jgi:hypothetical protein